MRCPICGTKNKNDAVECVACGSALVSPNSEAQSTKTATQKKDSLNKNSNKKSSKSVQISPEQVSTEENLSDTTSEEGVIPSVVIIGKEKEHIPMNIEYDLESEKYLEDEEDDDDEDTMFWEDKKKKTSKPLISGSDTAVYVCMGILGFLLVFAISYLAINIVLKDMGGETKQSSSFVAENTTENTSNGEETSSSVNETEESSQEGSSYDKEPWIWEETYKVEVIDGEVYLIEYVGNESIVKIPSEFDGYPLTMIEANSFLMCTSIEAVEVPEGVTQIGDYAFAECTNLKVIALPDSLISVSDYAFDGISETINVISSGDSYGFRLGLKTGYHWVYGKGLPEDLSQWLEEETETTQEMPTNTESTPVETTQEEPLPSNSDSFTQATFPADGTYTTVDGYETEWIFRTLTYADGSQEVVVVKYRGAGGVVVIPSEYNGVPVRYIGKAAFQNAANITEISIPASVIYIDYHAMADMQGCASVTIPSSVTFIHANAFEDVNLIIKGTAGSYAQAYCAEHPGLTWQTQ